MEKYMGKGFIPALGTPLDDNGRVVEESFRKQIEDQIKAGAAGLLCMGSMGIQAFIDPAECPNIARIAVDQAAGRVPVFVGAMDCTIAGAIRRMKAMDDIDVTAFVFTTPYYSPVKRPQIIRFFTGIAKNTKHNVMAYDLPGVTQSKITYDMLKEISDTCPNFIGVKTADEQMIRKIKTWGEFPENFLTCFSGLDTFDVCYPFGFTNYLDGMVSCCPKNFEKMDKALLSGDMATASQCLTNVVKLRDAMAGHPYLLAAYTEVMHLLGYSGRFHPDFAEDEPQCREEMRKILVEIGELE